MKKILALLLLLASGAAHSQQVINCINVPSPVACTTAGAPGVLGTGDANWLSFGKVNANFSTLFSGYAPVINVTGAPYNADKTGILDSTTAINSAIATAAGSCGVVYYPAGTYKTSSPLTITGCVTQSGYGATINYTGSGNAFATAATNSVNYAVLEGLTITYTNTAATALRLGGCYACTVRDVNITGVASATNVAILMDVNTSGTNNPLISALNTAFDLLENVQITTEVGTGIRFIGQGASNVTTDNTIHHFIIGGGGSTGGAAVYGIEYNQWADSNVFVGMTRINLFNNGGTDNAIGVVFGDGAGGGIYSESFEHLAIDTFGTPTTDNRAGIVGTNTLVKFITIGALEFGPGNPGNDITAANTTQIQSLFVGQAPRGATTYESLHFVGVNMGIGPLANTAAALYVGNVGQATGSSQYDVYGNTACVGPSTVALCANYDAIPSAASNATAYTVTNAYAYKSEIGAVGTNASITNVYSFYDPGQTAGTTANVGFYSAANTGTGRFAFEAAGTAPNSFAGPTAVGGSITNDSASAGYVGQFVTATVGSGSAVTLTTSTPANVTSMSLTAGDWDVWATCALLPAATTSITALACSTGTTSGTIGSFVSAAAQNFYTAFVPGVNTETILAPVQRISLASTTTVYVVCEATFTVSTMGCYGSISARRRR